MGGTREQESASKLEPDHTIATKNAIIAQLPLPAAYDAGGLPSSGDKCRCKSPDLALLHCCAALSQFLPPFPRHVKTHGITSARALTLGTHLLYSPSSSALSALTPVLLHCSKVGEAGEGEH
jgi:hypothetical protein